MSIETELYAYLVADPGVSAIIGDRLYPKRLVAEPTLPAAIYMVVSAPRMAYTHDNATGTPPEGTTLVQARVQLEAWAANYLAAVQLSEAITATLSGFHGTMGVVRVDKITIDSSRDDFEPDTGANRRIVDAILTYEEG